jgi:hypothetical protein
MHSALLLRGEVFPLPLVRVVVGAFLASCRRSAGTRDLISRSRDFASQAKGRDPFQAPQSP